MPAMCLQAALADGQRKNAALAQDNAAKAAKVRELQGHLIALAHVRRADKLPRAVSDAIRLATQSHAALLSPCDYWLVRHLRRSQEMLSNCSVL